MIKDIILYRNNKIKCKFLPNRYSDKFCLPGFNNFKNKKLQKKHKKFYENSDYIDRVPPKKFKIEVDKKQVIKIATWKQGQEIEVPG